MNSESASALAQQSLADLEAALAQGKSEAMTRYLDMLSRFHKYSFGNVMMILAQFPSATRCAGFQAWRSLGRYVKKGEKGIAIFAPMMLKLRESGGAGEASGDDTASTDVKRVLRFRVVHVFDISQTEGESLPEPVRVGGDPGACITRLEQFIASKNITVEFVESLGGAEGVSLGGRIQVLNRLSPAERFSTLVHECAHERLHRGEDRPATKTVRETEAEAVAFVVCRAIGLDTGTASSDYIALYQGDTATLTASLDRIQKTAAEIIAAVTAEADAMTESMSEAA